MSSPRYAGMEQGGALIASLCWSWSKEEHSSPRYAGPNTREMTHRLVMSGPKRGGTVHTVRVAGGGGTVHTVRVAGGAPTKDPERPT